MPRLTLALIGFSAMSKLSSVMLNSVMRTGTMRWRLHTKSVSAASAGAISMVPRLASSFEDVSSAVLSLTALLAPLLVPLLVAGGVVAGWALWRRRPGRRRAPA